jgi:hypothetical protein
MNPYLVFLVCLLLYSFIAIPNTSAQTETQVSETTPLEETTPKESFWKNNFSYAGELRQETAFRIVNDPNFSKIKQFLKAEVKFRFSDHYQFKLGGRGFYDAVYDVTDQYPPDVQDNLRKEGQLRDAYLDIIYPKVRARLGHQQIVWGEALAQFYADVVTPKDLREFFLPSFEDVRLMTWAVDLQINFSTQGLLEFVLVPDQTIDKLALPGSDFAFFLPPPPPGFDQVLLSDENPDNNFKNIKGGARISYLTHGWDLTGIFFTGPDTLPAYQVSFSNDQEFLTPIHPRVQHYGFTFSKSIGPVVTRGEFVYTTGKFFFSDDPFTNNGLVKRNQLRYDIGLDYFIASKVFMNAEFQQEVIYGERTGLLQDPLNTYLFLRFETHLLHEKLIPSLVFNLGFDLGDTQVSPRITFLVTPTIQFAWGVDIFSGPIEGLYGEFDASDRVYMNTIWKF